MSIHPATMMAIAQGANSLYGMFGKNNPGRAANKQLNQIPGYGRDAYNPFIQQGQQAQQQLSPQYSQMASNPMGQYNDIMSQYQPSAGYQYQYDKLNKAAGNTAASGGFAGTDNDVMNRSEMFQGLLGGDMQQFLQNILGIQGTGQAGLQHQADTGYHASGSLADYLGGASQLQARNSAFGRYLGNENRNSAMSGLGSLAGLLGGGKSPSGGATPFTPLNKGSYMIPQSSMAASSGLFGGR